MTASEKLTDLFAPALDSEHRITLSDAEQRVSEAGIDISEEFGFDSLEGTIEELDDYFILEEEDGTTFIKCLNVPENESAPPEDFTTKEEEAPIEIEEKEVESPTSSEGNPQGLSNKQKRMIANKIKITIYNISKNIRPNAEGLAPIPLLGIKLREHGVSDYGGKKLTDFIREYPDKFEILMRDGTLYARCIDKTAEKAVESGQEPQAPLREVDRPIAQPLAEEKRHISPYKLLDFALFPDYQGTLRQLAGMAESDGWFVLTDPDDPQPYYMVDLRLRQNFAMAVNQHLKGENSGITIGLDKASFITGFRTPEGTFIVADFIPNRLRNTSECQSWVFSGFRELEN